MKHVIFILMVCSIGAVSLSSFAAHEGPAASPPPPMVNPFPEVIAERTSNNGPVSPTYQRKTSLQVLSNGNVRVQETDLDNAITALKNFGPITKTEFNELTLFSSSLDVSAKLIDLDASLPYLIGGEAHWYSVQKNNKAFIFAERISGHHSQLQGVKTETQETILDRLSAQADLLPSEPLPHLLLELVTSIGFAPPDVVGAYGVKLYDSGELHAVNRNQEVLFKSLNSSVLNKVKLLISTLKKGPLFDPNAGSPLCMDSPETVLKAYKTNVSIDLEKKAGCHTSTLEQNNAKVLAELLLNWEKERAAGF